MTDTDYGDSGWIMNIIINKLIHVSLLFAKDFYLFKLLDLNDNTFYVP